jgi:DNA gyrase subunit A
VRAVDLSKDDTVISASLLRHFEASGAERDMYANGGSMKELDEKGQPTGKILTLPTERLVEMQNAEQLVLTVTGNGYGKKVSSHEFRTTQRGRKGINALATGRGLPEKIGPLVACFAVEENDSLIMVTDGGQTIRTPVGDINKMRRDAGGVRLFKLPDGQKLVGVARLAVTEAPQPEEPTGK